MNSVYSPFDKVHKDLQPSDLLILKTVPEGWYIEYKSEVPNPRAIAKALCAFANTYGGWLFLGVEERSKEDPVAGSFPGLPDEDIDGILQRIRNASFEHINPPPHFVTKLLRGPCTEIGLLQTRSILAVEIPQSHTTPHVHKDGRIYRRVADGSAPKPETDRFLLDQLWRRGDSIRKLTRKWVERDPEFSKAEAEVPFLRLLLCVDPWCQRDPWLNATLSEIKSIFTTMEYGIPSITFDAVYTMTDYIVARHVQENDFHNYVLTWRIRRDLSCDVVLPLPLVVPSSPDELFNEWNGYEHVAEFVDILRSRHYESPKIVDLNYVTNVITDIVWKYRRLLNLADADTNFFFKARILNAWRVVPFIDIEEVLVDFRQGGLPMVIDETVSVPMGNDPESFVHVSEQDTRITDYSDLTSSVIQSYIMFARIATAFGVACVTIGRKDEQEEDVRMIPYDKLKATGDRAMVVQRNRNRNRL